MKQNKSWEDQLSAIYTGMTGTKVDFAREKEKARRRKQDAVNRSLEKMSEDIIVLLKKNPTNSNTPGYSMATICGITTAVLPIGYQPNPKRLDAPCEMCVNFQCPYAQGELDNDRVVQYSEGKMRVKDNRAVLVSSSSYNYKM